MTCPNSKGFLENFKTIRRHSNDLNTTKQNSRGCDGTCHVTLVTISLYTPPWWWC